MMIDRTSIRRLYTRAERSPKPHVSMAPSAVRGYHTCLLCPCLSQRSRSSPFSSLPALPYPQLTHEPNIAKNAQIPPTDWYFHHPCHLVYRTPLLLPALRDRPLRSSNLPNSFASTSHIRIPSRYFPHCPLSSATTGRQSPTEATICPVWAPQRDREKHFEPSLTCATRCTGNGERGCGLVLHCS